MGMTGHLSDGTKGTEPTATAILTPTTTSCWNVELVSHGFSGLANDQKDINGKKGRNQSNNEIQNLKGLVGFFSGSVEALDILFFSIKIISEFASGTSLSAKSNAYNNSSMAKEGVVRVSNNVPM